MSLYLKVGEQFLNALDTIIDLGWVSGLVLNSEKNERLWLGSLANCYERICCLKWPNIIIYLGIYVGKDINVGYKRNWDDKLVTFQKLLDYWRLKNLTLNSKVNLLKLWQSLNYFFQYKCCQLLIHLYIFKKIKN